MSLYQKYRPKDFDSLVGQDFIKIALSNALAKDKLVGGYLFYGSRGTGKTTAARILARGMNCLALRSNGNPCNECVNCQAFLDGSLMDVVEIDAASNTGVDNIRDLIERAQFQPTQAKYKVYIIDEVHMLSKGAFNALLKTLEEPPAHVKFILATTELQKIPETIISRTQRFDFKKIDESDIVKRLAYIATKEQIKTEEEALKLIAKLARGGMRDAITLFEQYTFGNELTYDMIAKNLQLVGDVFLENFLLALIARDIPRILKDLDYLREQGIDMKIFIEQSTYFLRDKLIASVGAHLFSRHLEIFELFHDIYGKLRSAPNAFMLFEISVLGFVHDKNIATLTEIPTKKTETPEFRHPEGSEESRKTKNTEAKNETTQAEVKKMESNAMKTKERHSELISESQLFVDSQILKQVQDDEPQNQTIDWSRFDYGTLVNNIKNTTGKSFVSMSLKSSEYKTEENVLIIVPNNDFNRNKINTPEIIGFLGEELEKIVGTGARIIVK